MASNIILNSSRRIIANPNLINASKNITNEVSIEKGHFFLDFFFGHTWGMSNWVLLLMLFQLIIVLTFILWFKRHKILKLYWSIRYPEKLIKVVIHYETNLYKIFYRLLPTNNKIVINGNLYNYSDKHLVKHDSFATLKSEKDETYIVKINDKSYNIQKKLIVRNKDLQWPEIHFKFNNPDPINFNTGEPDKMSASQQQIFAENDLWIKLLTIEGEKMLIILVLIISIVGCMISLFTLSVVAGWIKLH